ncbi:hypothetical protein BJ508DRAFT_35046 [Ascobolus immersus RN42]|uniref:Uncharacterized protein n=1 Tax=Ascobolus immersus RN42 TaxID=1160509 RepID=A0A3N4HMJ6_ASCIM|nr:hypothetical protein BJ508DRAFT_35046 [Ascobolus immersus RN42]
MDTESSYIDNLKRRIRNEERYTYFVGLLSDVASFIASRPTPEAPIKPTYIKHRRPPQHFIVPSALQPTDPKLDEDDAWPESADWVSHLRYGWENFMDICRKADSRNAEPEGFSYTSSFLWEEPFDYWGLRDSFERVKRGLISEVQIRLMVIALEGWRVQLDRVLDEEGSSSENGQLTEASTYQLLAELELMGSRWFKLLVFVATLRSESIEARIWRYLHAADSTGDCSSGNLL